MYHIYPTLLNQYYLYKNEQKNAAGELLVPKEKLLASINREASPTTMSQQRGINFENAVITGKGAEAFDEGVIENVQNLLPKKYKTQVFNKFYLGKMEVYGYVDVLGEGRAIDIKTTQNYQPGSHQHNFQNLYLLGLKSKGVTQLDYIITDFAQVYVETYYLRSYNFTPMLEVLDEFAKFLEINRSLIRNTKIFGQDKPAPALPLFPNF
jgi:hypothetical protein